MVTARQSDPGKPPVAIECLIESDDWHALGDVDALMQACAQAASDDAPALRGGAVSLLLTDDLSVHALNRQFRHRDQPTNVLSFPAIAAVHPFLGDIAMAYGTTRREARDKAIALRDHTAHLIIHGLLHLVGYDHEMDEDAATMEGLETRILARLGVSDPYGADATGSEAEQ